MSKPLDSTEGSVSNQATQIEIDIIPQVLGHRRKSSKPRSWHGHYLYLDETRLSIDLPMLLIFLEVQVGGSSIDLHLRNYPCKHAV